MQAYTYIHTHTYTSFLYSYFVLLQLCRSTSVQQCILSSTVAHIAASYLPTCDFLLLLSSATLITELWQQSDHKVSVQRKTANSYQVSVATYSLLHACYMPIHQGMHACIHTFLHIKIYLCVVACICVMYIHIYTYVGMYMITRLRTYNVHICTHACIHTCIHTYIHAHMHARTCSYKVVYFLFFCFFLLVLQGRQQPNT